MLEFLRVKSSFCNLCDLQKGSKVVAWVGLIWGVMSIASIVLNNVSTTSLLGAIPYMVVSGFLLYGVKTRKPSFLGVWIFVKSIESIIGVCTVLLCVGLAVYVRMFQQVGNTSEAQIGQLNKLHILSVFGGAATIFTATGIYFLAVVYSHYRELKEELKEGGDKEVLTKDT